MAATQTSIANNALRMIGISRIASFADNVDAARILSDIYEDKVEHLLRDHLWNFAIDRAALPASATEPEWGYANRFPLPDDCLRVLSIEDDEFVASDKWRVEGRAIVTDSESPLNIVFVRRVDETEFDSSFRECLAAFLAAELAMPLTRNVELQAEMQSEAERKFRSARGSDGQEGSPPVLRQGTWVAAKHGPYGRGFWPRAGRWE